MKDSKWKDNPIGSKNQHGNPKKKRPNGEFPSSNS